MPARSRIAERAPSAATSSRADQRPAAVAEAHAMRDMPPARNPATARGAQLDALRVAPSPQRREQRAVLDHVGERLARLDLALEGEEGRPHRVLQPAVGDHHVEDRLRLDRVPHADGLEQPARRRRDGGGARIAARPAPAPDRRPRPRTIDPAPWRNAIASARPAKPRRRSAHRCVLLPATKHPRPPPIPEGRLVRALAANSATWDVLGDHHAFAARCARFGR